MKRVKKCEEMFRKLLQSMSMLCLILFLMLFVPVHAMAEEEAIAEQQWIEQEFLSMETPGEFTVMFYYEGERPKIIFIAPDGKEYAEGISTEEEFLSAHGDGWSTYKICNAEAGRWSIRCDKKNNEEIEYTLVDVVNGICVQSFSLEGIENTVATVRFEVTKGEEKVWYRYTVFAVEKSEQTIKQELASGQAMTMEPLELSVQLNISDSEECYLLLEVVQSGTIETFDSMEIGPFVYDNPNTVPEIEDFEVDLNLESGLCEVDWSSFRNGGWNTAYRLEAVSDGNTEEPLYSITTEANVASFYYPADAETLEIRLSVIRNHVFSEPKTKTIDLKNGEYVRVLTDEITTEATLKLGYKQKHPSELYVILNEKSGVYVVEGENTLSFTIENGWNTVKAYFTGDDRITYRTEKEVYYTWLAPEIKLYEKLDGKTLSSETAKLSGNVKDAESLTINGVTVQKDEKGEFVYEVPLTEGENIVTIEATAATGAGATKAVTITRKSAQNVQKKDVLGAFSENVENGQGLPEMSFVELLPLIGMLFAGPVLILGFFLCTAKKKKGIAVALAVLFAVAAGIAGVLFLRLHGFNNSIAYVELAKSSTETAVSYLEYEKYMKWTAMGAAGLFVVTVLGIVTGVLVGKLKKKSEV